MRIIIIALSLILDFSPAAGAKLFSECDAASEVRANVEKDAPLQVRSSISSGSPCYAVIATIDGKEVRGYVMDGDLDAVIAFEKAKNESLRAVLSLPPVVTAPEPPPAPTPAPAAAPAPAQPQPEAAKPAAEVPAKKPNPAADLR
jgi:hypothetical protein